MAIGFALSLCAAQPSLAEVPSESEAATRWETMDDRPVQHTGCGALASNRLVPVTPTMRDEAIARLENAQSTEVSEAEAVSFVGHAAEVNDSTLRPFLVRAVAKNDLPTFWAIWCEDGALVVLHGSLGRSEPPPSRRTPLVLWLDRAPTRVDVRWSMAE